MPVNHIWPSYQRPLEQTGFASFACWACSGTATIEVTPCFPIRTVDIRSKAGGIGLVVQGRTIRFVFSEPGQVVVEVNGWHHATHLFATPIVIDPPSPAADNVIYFGPGKHYAGIVRPQDGKTVYIAGGALVHGVIEAIEVSGVRGYLGAAFWTPAALPEARLHR